VKVKAPEQKTLKLVTQVRDIAEISPRYRRDIAEI